MKLTCGPVTSHTDGIVVQHDGSEMINKQITLNSNYSNNKEDNNFSIWTPSATLTFQLTNPACDIFAPGKKFKVILEEWTE